MTNSTINNFVKQLAKTLENNSNPEIASKQSAYMKNHFHFYGVQKPQRMLLLKSALNELSIENECELVEVLDKLWRQTYREFHYCAWDIAEKYLMLASDQTIQFFEQMIRNNSWWDTVDKIASNLVGPILLEYPKSKIKMNGWIRDSDMWIRRSALLFQLRHKRKTDEQLLFSYCCCVMGEKEFFIQKAIGWALREYSKTSPKSVSDFITKYRSTLSPLSIREGLKIISKKH